MDKEMFWSLIDKGRQESDGWCELIAESIEENLKLLATHEIIKFDLILDEYEDAAYKERIWDAAKIINNGCSDDGFIDFRRWLIAQGKEVYLEALKNPDSLAKIDLIEPAGFEGLGYIANNVYREAAGFDIFDAKLQLSFDEKDSILSEIDYHSQIDVKVSKINAANVLPRLCQKYSDFFDAADLSIDTVRHKTEFVISVINKTSNEAKIVQVTMPCEDKVIEELQGNISITQYNFGNEDSLAEVIPADYNNLKELNLLAYRLNELARDELGKFDMMIISNQHGSVKELINLTYNLDQYEIWADCHGYTDVGARYVREVAPDLDEHIFENINLENLGSNISAIENGQLIENGYIHPLNTEKKIIYTGDNIDKMLGEYEYQDQNNNQFGMQLGGM